MRGTEDITPVFESYHALAHSAAIRQTLEKFEFSGKVGGQGGWKELVYGLEMCTVVSARYDIQHMIETGRWRKLVCGP